MYLSLVFYPKQDPRNNPSAVHLIFMSNQADRIRDHVFFTRGERPPPTDICRAVSNIIVLQITPFTAIVISTVWEKSFSQRVFSSSSIWITRQMFSKTKGAFGSLSPDMRKSCSGVTTAYSQTPSPPLTFSPHTSFSLGVRPTSGA